MTQPRKNKRSWKERLATFARSGLVGVVATGVDLLCLWALVAGAGLDPRWANLPALGFGLAVQFFGNKFFAFGDHSRAYVRQGSQFALVEVGALALNGILFHVLVTFTLAQYLVARLVGSALVYFAFSYPLWRLIFRPAAKPRTIVRGG